MVAEPGDHFGTRFVVGASRQEVKRWQAQSVEESGWMMVREGVEAKPAKEGNEPFVRCDSAERQKKDRR